MSSPWQGQTIKDVQGITHAKRVRPGHRFTPPPPASSVQFTRDDLCASIAVTSTLSGVSAAVSKSLAQATAQFVTDHVDDGPPTPLEFLSSVLLLADSTRTYFSSCIGAGFADRYALALGYRFRCNSREVIATGRTGDFLYHGPTLQSGDAVMVEAKGSLVRKLSTTAFRRVVDAGYVGQVAPHIGKTYVTAKAPMQIVHGYAIGCGAGIPARTAIGHVVDCVAAGPRGRRKKKVRRTSSTTPQKSPSLASAPIALGNYRAVAMLLGFPQLVDAIERAREGARPRGASQLSKEVRRFTWRGELFIEFSSPERKYDVALSRRLLTAGASRVAPLRFALWEPVFAALLRNLATLPPAWEVPPVPSALFQDNSAEGGAVLPDGFALLPERYERAARSHTATDPISPILASEDMRPPAVRRHLSTAEQIEEQPFVEYQLPTLHEQEV